MEEYKYHIPITKVGETNIGLLHKDVIIGKVKTK